MIKKYFTTSKIEETHPSAEELLRCVDGELSAKETAQVRSHLETCWNCRLQLEKIEETISSFVSFRQQIQIPLTPEPPKNWGDFNQKLNETISKTDLIQKSHWVLSIGKWNKFFQDLKNFSASPVARQMTIATIAAFLIAVIFWQFISVKTVSAAELLDRAAQSQIKQLERISQPVIYQKLRINSNKTAETQWEVWGDKTRSRYRQNIGNENHYRELQKILESNGFNSQEPLSAGTFAGWRKGLIEKRDTVEKNQSENGKDFLVLRTLNLRADTAGKISEGILKVLADDFHPVEQTLRIITPNGTTEDYTFTELDFQVLSLTDFKPDFFSEQITPQVAAITPKNLSSTTNANTSPSVESSPAIENNTSHILRNNEMPKVESLKVTASVDLEVEVLNLLNQAKADLGEQITVKRETDGLLYVRGMVETTSRKQEVLQTLQPVVGNPAVRVEIKTVDDAIAELKNTPKPNAKTETIESQSNKTAADSELLAYFKTEQSARTFGGQIIRRSNRAMSRAYALKRLIGQFKTEELNKLSPESQAKWLELIRSHARVFREETESLRRELQPVFDAPNVSASRVTEVNNINDISRAVTELLDFAITNDRVVRSAFTLSSGAQFSAIKNPQFWQSLKNAEAIAAKLQSVK